MFPGRILRDANGGDIALTADTAGTWGVVETVYTDTSITDAATLKAAGLSVLARTKDPTVSVNLDADELYELTGETIDRFSLGRLCLLPLNDYGVIMRERVIGIQYSDLLGAPAKVKVVLANRDKSAVQDIATLSRKSAITELYSQGAATHFEIPFADNADPAHPARLKFYIDNDAIHVNAVKVKFASEPFRGYSKAARASGASSVTSESLPATTLASTVDMSSYGGHVGAVLGPPYSTNGNAHTSLPVLVAGEQHRHTFNHSHDLSLDFEDFKFQVTLPAHNHTVSIPSHTHQLEHGIYEGGTAGAYVVQVDGQTVPVTTPGEFDALPYLAKDDQGKIKRGAWHEVTFTPDGLTRVTANLYVRTFIRSLTGANL